MRIEHRSAVLLSMALLPFTSGAFELVRDGRAELNADLEAALGLFRSGESYAQLPGTPGGRTWQEGYARYGLSGSYELGSESSFYGAVSLLSSGTWGDGDAAGFTIGTERRTALEDAYIGWRSGDLIAALGKDGLDLSAGRQTFMIGDGFLVYGDAESFGKGFDQLATAGIAPGSLDRGGAYYLAGRQAFDDTAILRLGGKQGARGDAFWLKSDNRAQAKTELAGLNLEYASERYGSLGLTYLRGLSVDQAFAEFLGLSQRDGQETFGIRASGSAGVENLSLSGEYVHQDNGSAGKDRAWYLEAGWTFAGTAWKPNIGARYSRFSTGFDPLFYGLSRGYGTWYQGEVAGNYAGPFNTNADIGHLYLTLQPLPGVSVGALYFDFRTRDKALENLNASELDLYAEWAINDRFSVSPLIGLYRPEKSAREGGVQLGDASTNLYAQVTLAVSL